MGLCEVPHIMLRPEQLYRFVVMPDCQKCKDAAAPYQTNEIGEARADNAAPLPPATL